MRTCFNINLDSLGDKTFHLMHRFFELSDRYDFKYTIFVCGKDLEKDATKKIVRSWAKAGHEIASHGYSHPYNFSQFLPEETHDEIYKSHRIISDCTGKAPIGFTSPCWNPPDDLFFELECFGYKYDASILPSPLLWFIHREVRKQDMPVVSNMRYALSSRHKHRRGMLTELPLPTTMMRIPCWHTMAYYAGGYFSRILKSSFSDNFYYLMHPADLMDKDDFPRSKIARIDVPYVKKRLLLEGIINFILDHTDKTVTMEELCA